MKKTTGRPTAMTPKTLDKLREAFLMGCTDREACIYANIAESTFYAYQQGNTEFSEGKTLWKLNPTLKARKTIFDNLENVAVAKWYLERKEKGEFGGTESETVTSPIQVVFVDEETKT